MRKIAYFLAFNVIVGLIGFVSLAFMYSIGSKLVLEPGEDFVEPLAAMAGIFFFAITANVVLLAGSVHASADEFRTRFRRVLLWFSLFATTPVWIASMAYLLDRI
jgi:mannose/fructose/N-acetylgalactosamine-specific phosphotransferase system component IID